MATTICRGDKRRSWWEPLGQHRGPAGGRLLAAGEGPGRAEADGAIVSNNEILVIPAVNYYSMNIGKRFWAADTWTSTACSRERRGGDHGADCRRRVFAGPGVQLRDSVHQLLHARGVCPHVRMGWRRDAEPSLANLFGLPYMVIRTPPALRPRSTPYNWQSWNTSAFSIYTSATDRVDTVSAGQAVASVLRVLTRMGILRYTSHSGYIASVIRRAI